MIEANFKTIRIEDFKKTGANKREVNKIGRLFDEGMTTDQISEKMLIRRDVIESFRPSTAVVEKKAEPEKSKARRL